MKQLIAALVFPLLLVVVLVVPQVFFIIDETEQGIITQFGEYKRTIREPGFHAKMPMIQTLQKFDRRILVSDSSPAEYLTGDKKRVVVDHITRWQIVDPLKFFKSVHNEQAARARLDDIVFSELRKELALHEFSDILSARRDAIVTSVTNGTAAQAKEFGIDVRDVRIKRVDLPREVQESVFARMVAERERIAKKYRSEGEEQSLKIRAETDKEKSILLAEAYQKAEELRGRGDAESTKVYAAAYSKDPEFYRFLRSLSTYENGFAEGSVLVLSGNEKLLQYLADSQAEDATPR
ncbi:MAG: protease modulator HflC [Candidatus Omnitrophica bacterium]|nr:protease modulator HflC [Candidatus Omnitrophota bacterium]